MSKPFAKSRRVYANTSSRHYAEVCTCKVCQLAERLSDEPVQHHQHTGYCYFEVKRLNFTAEESLEATARAIRDHYAFVASELQQPFTMGFCHENGNKVGQSDAD